MNFLAITKEIYDEYENIRKYLRNMKPREKVLFNKRAKEIFNSQVKIEDDFITKHRICNHHDDKKENVVEIEDLEQQNIITKLKYEFYNYDYMEEIRCMINKIIDIENGDVQSERARIHHFIGDLKKFGSNSAFNYAIKGKIEDSDKPYKIVGDIVVAKCPRVPFTAKELIHELCIGLNGLNNLRKSNSDRPGIPNFSYVYDAFYCSAPIVNENNKEIIEFCMGGDNQVSYVLYENINDSISFRDFTNIIEPGISGKNYLLYLMQISLSLYMANKECDFTHYDCHTENILLRNYDDKPFMIQYKFEDQLLYIESPGKIATFIDYGMSHIKTDNLNIGILDSSGIENVFGINTLNSNVMLDIHKFLCFNLNESQMCDNKDIIILSTLLLQYFYSDDFDKSNVYNFRNFSSEGVKLENVEDSDFNFDNYISNDDLMRQFKLRFHVTPNVLRDKGWNLKDFILHLRDSYIYYFNDDIFVKETENNIFGKFKSSLSKKEEKEGKKEKVKVSDKLSFFDLLQFKDDTEYISKFKKNISLVISDESIIINKLLSFKHHGTLFVIDEEYLNDTDHKKSYIHDIEQIAELINIFSQLVEKKKEVDFCKTIIVDKEIESMSKMLGDRIHENLLFLRHIKSTLVSNFSIISKSIFSYPLDHIATEKELNDSHAQDNINYNIYDKYEKVILIVKELIK
jgi:hypothetical protein